jgi:hypothetical protein
MHEFGHTLGLNHGGAETDAINCKPNYISVMNYAFSDVGIRQTVGCDWDNAPSVRPDYSGATLVPLDESNLNETVPIGSGDDDTRYLCSALLRKLHGGRSVISVW